MSESAYANTGAASDGDSAIDSSGPSLEVDVSTVCYPALGMGIRLAARHVYTMSLVFIATMLPRRWCVALGFSDS